MSFKVGDKVRFVHEKGEGIVTGVKSPYKIKVELVEGLEIEVPASELVAISEMPIKDAEITPKEVPVKKTSKKMSKPHASHDRVVDLHIEELTDNFHLMTNTQKLNLQLDHFKEELDDAIAGHIHKIVFIHGVGNGVLRQAIRDMLKRWDGVEYSDGAYKKYGAGATEVRIIARTKAK